MKFKKFFKKNLNSLSSWTDKKDATKWVLFHCWEFAGDGEA
jgi:hypothetical protein